MLKLIRYVLSHPLSSGYRLGTMRRLLWWQIVSRMINKSVRVPFTDRTSLLLERGMTGATGNYYCGLHEFEEMSFLLHFLRAEDTFFDVGANVGSYTVLAAGHLKARTYAFEPVPKTFQRLCNNVRCNGIDNLVVLKNYGIGNSEGSLRFTVGLDTINHVFAEDDDSEQYIEVPVMRLDDLTKSVTPTCIKIDVEGYETAVIDGSQNILQSPELKVVIIELNGSGKRYGFNDETIHRKLTSLGFCSYRYEPFQRNLIEADHNNIAFNNVIYIRDADFVKKRIASGEEVKLPWRNICKPTSSDCRNAA